MTLTEQVCQALDTFHQAHHAAEEAAAAYAEAKRRAGSNEKDRTRICTEVGDETYALYLMDLAKTETDHKAAAAHLERVEKNLNVLRELLQLETATRHRQAAEIGDTTAQRYAVMPGNYTTHAEFRARYSTPTGNGIKRATVAADESELPF